MTAFPHVFLVIVLPFSVPSLFGAGLTPTIGSKAIKGIPNSRNIDMMDFTDNGWPSRVIDFSDNNSSDRWLHTDLLSVPHFFTHRLFHKLVDEGEMK